MTNDIYTFKDYKKYIFLYISEQKNGGRGIKLKMAKHLGCNSAFVSQVLNSHVHFSLEQAALLNELFQHNEIESEFFVLLVQYARAGSAKLEKIIERQLSKIKSSQRNLKNRLDFEKELTNEDQSRYYSAWYFSAIHVAVSIPTLQTKEALCQELKLPMNIINDVLLFLHHKGLIEKKLDRHIPAQKSIHLGNNSTNITKHHTNWRIKAIESLPMASDSSQHLHYSSVISIAADDIPKVREKMIKTIEDIRQIVKPSKEELLYSYCLDLFSV